MVLGGDGVSGGVLPDCMVYFRWEHSKVFWGLINEEKIFNTVAMLSNDYPVSGMFFKERGYRN